MRRVGKGGGAPAGSGSVEHPVSQQLNEPANATASQRERRCGRGRHMGDERTSRPALVAPACPGIVRNRSARARNPGVTLLHETTAPCAVTVRREIACGSALSRGRDLGEPHARGGT
jgi:hypothetical protein